MQYFAKINFKNFEDTGLKVILKESANVVGEDESYFKGDTCKLEYRRRTRGMVVEANCSMEVPIALTHYLRPNLKFDIVTTKTFLTMLCR